MAERALINADGIPVISPVDMWSSIEGVPIENRLSELLRTLGCEFADEEGLYVTSNNVVLAGIGGVPVSSPGDSKEVVMETIDGFRKRTIETMGASAAFSYLNPLDRSLEGMFRHTAELGHHSIAHTVNANLILAGITQATELELSLQRDLVHISKTTNTRTRSQTNPPVVIKDRSEIDIIESIRARIANLPQANNKDGLEHINGLLPVNKASVLMITGTIRNLMRLSDIEKDEGKERELREVSAKIKEILSKIWPDLY